MVARLAIFFLLSYRLIVSALVAVHFGDISLMLERAAMVE